MLKTIIIDDEQSCIETLQLMLQKKFSQQVQVMASITQPLQAAALIQEHQPDLVFLDIEMPELTGLELLQNLPQINFQVVFTTAHEQYAISAIKLNALDYLTKPIALSELAEAIKKCEQKQHQPNNQLVQMFLQQLKTNAVKKIAIPSGNTTQFVPVNEIIRIESQSNYSIFYFINRPKITVTKTLKEYEEQLAAHNFIRVHQSHLVNTEHIIGFKNQDSGYLVMYGNDIVEISRRKKQEVMQKLSHI